MKNYIISLFTTAALLCACESDSDLLGSFPDESKDYDMSLPETGLKFSADLTDTTMVILFDENSFPVRKSGTLPVSRTGVCFSLTEKNPTFENSYVFDALCGSTKRLSMTIEDQKPSTTWYVRPFAMNALGVSYGQTQEITSLPAFSRLKVVNHWGMGNGDIQKYYSTSAYSITTNTMVIQVPADSVQAQGVCYGLEKNPTIDDGRAMLFIPEEYPTETGIAFIRDLKPSTVYHIRAFAEHTGGHVVYSQDLSVKTRDAIPSLSIRSSYASFIGSIRDNGGSIFFQRGGFCYAKGHMPTLEDAYTTPVQLQRDETSWSMYSISDNLEKNTKYLVRFFTFEDPIEYNEDGSVKPLPEITPEYLATKKIYYSDPISFAN